MFELHRAVITVRSKYFAVACKECFVKGRTREIHLDEIAPEVFEIVASWLYENPLNLFRQHFDFGTTVAIYKAADYLLIPTLRHEIFRLFCSFLVRGNRTLGRAHRKPYNKKQVYDFIRELSAYSNVSDWAALRDCVRSLISNFRRDESQLLGFLVEKPGNVFFSALLVETFQHLLDGNIYGDCQHFVKFKARKRRCRVCTDLGPKPIIIGLAEDTV
ncbi:hypothetical protein TWF694_004602 [Orbilia ellipsospora]|uniref:BTB domain-containing protein n=1 Tax=Orbilia ellipsospora TaxID=2528407 RepID=A0AAV9WWY0_9PEZI